MESNIREKFNEEIMREALKRFGISETSVKKQGGFESFIFEYGKNGKEYILRISHSSRRTSDMINGELHWLNYLADNGVPAARAVESENGRLVEVIEAGDSYFSAASFEKARGKAAGAEEWNDRLFEAMGSLVGRMHRLTKAYKPEAQYRRPEWHEELEGFAEKYLPQSEEAVMVKSRRILEQMYSLPVNKDNYGLIHIDVHKGNFFVDNGKITLFDFDDCQYCWFAADIAIVLFYAVPHDCASSEELEKARNFYRHFMKGYAAENILDREELKHIPLFLKQRELDLYVCVHRSCDLDNLNKWARSFMKDRKYKILNDIPYVDIDFTERKWTKELSGVLSLPGSPLSNSWRP